MAFWSFAIGHGAQYLIFMTVVAEGRSKRFGAYLIAGVTLVGTTLFGLLTLPQAGAPIYSGIVIGHFLVDAKFWKMREPEQRRVIRERFGFLFG